MYPKKKNWVHIKKKIDSHCQFDPYHGSFEISIKD
jgi:hypothetical protein